MTKDQTWIAALVFLVTGGFLAGWWYGGSEASKDWRKLLYRADLPEVCQQRIEDAREQLNFADTRALFVSKGNPGLDAGPLRMAALRSCNSSLGLLADAGCSNCAWVGSTATGVVLGLAGWSESCVGSDRIHVTWVRFRAIL